MVNAKSRRNPFVRLSLLLGTLALLALLLTIQAPPAQAADHVTGNQSCTNTSSATRQPAPTEVLVSIDVSNCFTNHGSGELTLSITPKADLGEAAP